MLLPEWESHSTGRKRLQGSDRTNRSVVVTWRIFDARRYIDITLSPEEVIAPSDQSRPEQDATIFGKFSLCARLKSSMLWNVHQRLGGRGRV